MSNFREKAQEIKSAGIAERNNFTPHGVPKRIYSYWLNNSQSRKAVDIRTGYRRENFCHFWRVVVIWAGLLRLGHFLMNVFDTVITTKWFAIIAGMMMAVAFTIALTVTGAWLGFLAVIGIIVGIIALSFGIVLGCIVLHDKYWNSDWNERAGKIAGWSVLSLMAAFAIFLIVLLTINVGWIFLICLGIAVVLASGLIYGISKWTNHLAGKRALARKKHQEFVHSLTYDEYCNWIDEQGKKPEPGRFDKALVTFFSGIGDFLILIGQIVRVKKWKICPFVEID